MIYCMQSTIALTDNLLRSTVDFRSNGSARKKTMMYGFSSRYELWTIPKQVYLEGVSSRRSFCLHRKVMGHLTDSDCEEIYYIDASFFPSDI